MTNNLFTVQRLTGVKLLRHVIFRVVGVWIELLQFFLLLLLFLFTFRQFSLEGGVCVVERL